MSRNMSRHWSEILENAYQIQKKAQESGTEAWQQPESQGQTPAQTRGETEQNNCNIGQQDKSIADLRLESFRESNQKLSKNKSQLPNLAAQARIFEPVTPGRRKFFKEWRNIPVIGRNDIVVEHKFHQLNQLDLTGWLVLLKFSGSNFISTFTRYEFLKTMKKQDSSRDYNWLRTFIDRIAETRFALYLYKNNTKWERYTGALALQDFERSDGKFAVELSQPLAAMFGFDGWSFINIEDRFKLGQNQWAQAFHAWASTHTCPTDGFWWKKEDFWREWGPEYKELENFMRLFKRRVIKPLYDIEFIKKVTEKKTAVGIWW